MGQPVLHVARAPNAGSLIPIAQSNETGFRIAASVPEPTTATLIATAVFGLSALGRPRRF